MHFPDAIWWRHNKSKMADGRHIENRFLAISRRHIGRSMQNLVQRWRITCRYSHVTKTAIFANSTWRTAAILKIASSPYLSRELSNFNQIWSTDAYFHSKDGFMTKKSKFFKFKMADGCHIENVFFAYISATYWPINAKFGPEIKNHMPIQVIWPKLQFPKTQDGGRPPFWK